jgi:hypothetical protein
MYSLTVLILIAIFAFPNLGMARIRCGNDLISEGDTAFDVAIRMRNCEGEIVGRQTIGERGTGHVEMNTTYQNRGKTSYSEGTIYAKSAVEERWYVRLKEGAYHYCYRFLFLRGTLEKIEGWERCD